MGLYEWVAAMRKKPIAVRRRVAALLSIAVMAVIAAVWFICFFLGIGNSLKSAPKIEITMPQMPALDPQAQELLHKFGF
jgi:hypothetical protein